MDAAVRAYKDSSSQMARDQLITDHLKNVRHILGRMLVTLPDNIDRENLEAAGVLGLVEAAHHFDPNRNVEFGAFAYFRIRGAIIDELRRNCPLPQQMLEKWARIRQAMDQIVGPATVEDMAERCGLEPEEVEQCLNAMRLTRPEAWQDDFALADSSSMSIVEHQDRAARLTQAIEKLDERSRSIVIMYHRDELRLKEIGEVLDLSESRVCRLLEKAHLQLKLMLKDEFEN